MTYREHELMELKNRGYIEIDGYPDYFVNPHGSILDMVCDYPRELRRYVDMYGNHIVTLKDTNRTPENFYLCAIVASHFIENSEKYQFVKHIDGDKGNNDVNNLQWSDVSYYKDDVKKNIIANGHIKKRRRNSKRIICKETEEIYEDLTKAALALRVSPAYICKKLKGNGNIKGCHYYYEGSEREFTEEVIECESLENEYIMAFDSIREASKELGIDRRKISEALRSDGIADGYIFRISECTI